MVHTSFSALSTYENKEVKYIVLDEKECGKVKHTARPADQPPAVVPSAQLAVTMKERPDPCQRQACDIQGFEPTTKPEHQLQTHRSYRIRPIGRVTNNYKESRCESVLRAMERCCEKPWAQDSVCCSGFRKNNRRKQEDKEKR
ncbi:Cx9C motif-containing protein 4, mitochondrial [Branchiostoma belcheri]|nr:Cx9C motif-containing protein 4, mitochondrial [Branchiostoma belcheri]